MKTKSLLPALIAVAVAFSLNALAHGGNDHDDDDDDDNGSHQGCHNDDHEVFKAVVVLTATTNAPAGARGVAKIDAESKHGHKEAEIELKLVGLNDGDYLLIVNLAPEGTNTVGTNVVLGQITIGEEDDDDDRDCDRGHRWNWWHHKNGGCKDDFKPWILCNWGGFTNWGSWTNWTITNWCNASNEVTIVEAEVDLPEDLNPASITQIILSDSNDVAILIGDVVKPATNTVINISATIRLRPGMAAPSAAGMAQLQSTALKGKWKHVFNLSASGMGANSNFRMQLNDKKIGSARSNKAGQLAIKKLPPKFPAIRSLRLIDAKGAEAARAQF